MKTVLVTGCDYGLGLELAREGLRRGYRVFAGCRRSRSAREVRALEKANPGRLAVMALDMSAESSIRRAARLVARKTPTLDLLINSAGIFWNDGLDKVDFKGLARMMAVNAFGPICLARHLHPLLRAAGRGKVINISSESGSLGVISNHRPIYAYAASKAALNMFMRRMAFECAGEGITAIALHPGWMQTPMGRVGGGKPTQPPQRTAEEVFQWADRMGPAVSGQFFEHDGKPHPW